MFDAKFDTLAIVSELMVQQILITSTKEAKEQKTSGL
jgi:hypothetical protein